MVCLLIVIPKNLRPMVRSAVAVLPDLATVLEISYQLVSVMVTVQLEAVQAAVVPA